MVEGDVSLSVEGIARALVNIYKGNVDIDHEVEENLFQETRQIFNEAITEGYANAAETDIPLPNDTFNNSFRNSADVFSAFRVHRMQQDIAAQMIDDDGQLKPFPKFVKDVSPYIEHRNRAWLKTEYNTAVIRAQNAAEWKMFEQEKDVYPNLEWIQSTSPDPGADHMIYWGTIRPVDDAFWNEHRPGDRWNCKCELRQTDKSVTAVPESDGKSDPARGLETNPAKAEELFSQKHPYYPQGCMRCPFAGNKLMALAMDLAGRRNCHACWKINKTIGKAIDNSHNKSQTARYEITNFVHKHLRRIEKNGQEMYQKSIKSKNGDSILFRPIFFKETLAKCVRKRNTGETMRFAFDFAKWARKMSLVRIEEGLHHDCKFRVYEVKYKGKRIELKAKDTQGFIAYMIRVYNK